MWNIFSMDEEQLNQLETSLKNYFLSYDEDNRGQIDHSKMMKYRGLSLEVDNKEVEEPAFKVRIGAFEASFRVRDGLKVRGSLCGDEKKVSKWYYRGYNQQTIIQAFSSSSDISAEPVKIVATNYVETKLNLGKQK